jgi:ribosomal protein L15
MPLQRRLPKRGFKNTLRVEYAEITLGDLAKFFPSGGTIDMAALREKGLVKGDVERLKIVGGEEIQAVYHVTAHKMTQAAREAIEAKGGSVRLLETARHYRRITLGNIAKKFPRKGDVIIEVTPQALVAAGLLSSADEPYEIIASGTINAKYAVSAHRLSLAARRMIEAKGGRFQILSPENAELKIDFNDLRSWFPHGGTVNPETLRKLGVLKGECRIRLTDFGRVTQPWKVEVHHAGRLAKKKLEAAGGSVILLPFGK